MPEVRPLVLYTDSGRIERMRPGDTLPGAGGGAGMPYAYVRRPVLNRIFANRTGAWLAAMTLEASTLYFVPFVLPRSLTLTELRINVTTTASGSASVGVYDNVLDGSGNDVPGSLRVAVSGLNTAVAGMRSGSVSHALSAGVLYWAALIASGTPQVAAMSDSNMLDAIGPLEYAFTTRTHLRGSGSGSTLPTSAPTSLSSAEGEAPAIYYMMAG